MAKFDQKMASLDRLALAKAAEATAHRPTLQKAAVEELFERALQGQIPRYRELKPNEPARLNETHLAMITMRAGGIRQNVVARAFGVTDANVSVVMNHPDGEYVLARLQALKAQDENAVEERLKALTDPAIEALEDVFFDPDIAPIKKTSLATRVLAMNGYGATKKVEGKIEHNHNLRLEASAGQVAEFARALRESSQLKEIAVVDAPPLAGGSAAATVPPGTNVTPSVGATPSCG